METLLSIAARNVENLQMVILFAKTKISIDNMITDHKTLVDVKRLLADFIETLNNNIPFN